MVASLIHVLTVKIVTVDQLSIHVVTINVATVHQLSVGDILVQVQYMYMYVLHYLRCIFTEI